MLAASLPGRPALDEHFYRWRAHVGNGAQSGSQYQCGWNRRTAVGTAQWHSDRSLFSRVRRIHRIFLFGQRRRKLDTPHPGCKIAGHQVAGGLRTDPLPSAQIDAAGTVYVVWQDCAFRRSAGQPVAAKLNVEVTLHLALNEPGRARLLVVPIRPSQDFGFQPLG
jgi:hypothetical protein